MFRNIKTVPRVLFGRGSFNRLNEILASRRRESAAFMVFLVDRVFEHRPLADRLPLKEDDRLFWIDTTDEPKTGDIDQLVARIQSSADRLPGGIIGIGGGSTLDTAKAVSLLLTNPGPAADYQGWDLIRFQAVYHVGIPTLSGTGAEVSRTAVLTGPDKKLGINSDCTIFDQVILDPELLQGAPPDQRFYTGMDCYIHCVESLRGTFINAFSRAHAEKAMDLCREVFLEEPPDPEDKLMMASYFGGLSIAYSQVGICHALSYGLSFVLGLHHGLANCVAFDCLEDYYPQEVAAFRRMMDKHDIRLPRGLTADLGAEQLSKMSDVALILEPLWENALGQDWKQIMTPEKIRQLYQRM
jgi:3-deoxy-alpha-D-manno-octulosonate 8-oxidase